MARDGGATRRALLETALGALRELTLPDLVTAIGTREIARRAGVSPAALFHHFGSTEGFAQAILDRVFDHASPIPDQVHQRLHEVRVAERPGRAGLTMHRRELERLSADPEHRLRIGLWAFGGDAGRQAYGSFVGAVDHASLRQVEHLLADWGREIRPPYDAATFVAAHTALLTGTVVRRAADPGAVDIERFAQMATALTLALLRVPGDRLNLEDRLAEIDHYPGRKPSGRVTTRRRLVTRERVLDAAENVFDRLGYGRATIPDVAREAFVAPTTVYTVADGKGDLACALLLDRARAAQLDGLASLADFLLSRADHLAPYVSRLATSGTGDDDPLLTCVAAVLGPHQAAVAQSALLVLTSQVLLAPAGGVEHLVTHLGQFLGLTETGGRPRPPDGSSGGSGVWSGAPGPGEPIQHPAGPGGPGRDEPYNR